MLLAGCSEVGHGLGLGHFVEEGEVSHIFARWRERNHGWELIAPKNLVWQVGGADLAGGRGRLNGGAHNHQQLKVGQLGVCPATTWMRQKETVGGQNEQKEVFFYVY